MPQTNRSQIDIFDARRLPVRLGIGAALAATLLFGWFAIRWQLGNMLAEHTSPTDPNAKNTAQAAADLAPRDPLAQWLLVNTGGASPSENNIERVVQLSPADFRWWIELGRDREQAGDNTAAEKALQKSVALAPNYTFPHWQLGNFYLRQNRGDDAFKELGLAAQNNVLYGEQVFSLGWEYFEHDTARLEQIAGDFPNARAGLAKFYAAKGRAADSLRLWNSLSEDEKQANSDEARFIAQSLYEKQFFRQALEFVHQLGIEPDARAETVQNGSFERPIGEANDVYFNWKTAAQEKLDVKLDPTQKHEGNRSLRVTFNNFALPTLYNISQIVVVEPRARYRLSFWLRTENLKSGGAPNLEIYNPFNASTIAASQPFTVGTNDWQQVKIEFTAPENAEAVTVRTTRQYCGEQCPISGIIWYDDFRLEKLK